jgi:hypothetical protein
VYFNCEGHSLGAGVFACFAGGIFPFSGDFSPFWSISAIFESGFSPFCRFFNSQRRYTRAGDARLMYSSSRNRVKAGQLGPSAYRFVQTVYLGLKPWFPLVQLGVGTRERCEWH